jgi:hypothetical protein
MLSAEPVLPGFALDLADLFREISGD